MILIFPLYQPLKPALTLFFAEVLWGFGIFFSLLLPGEGEQLLRAESLGQMGLHAQTGHQAGASPVLAACPFLPVARGFGHCLEL